jgi:ferric-dicitrate binding protein FerR (iron transport regulator)
MDERIDILLARYFSGEATTAELKQLDVWLAESEDHEAYFEQMTSLYRKISPVPSMPLPDTEKALASYKKYIGRSSQNFKKKNVKRRFFAYGFAAIIALLIGVFVFINIKDAPQNIIYLKAENKDMNYQLSSYNEVLLSFESQIEYNEGNPNMIKLSGKATFTVDSKKGESIVVQAGETYVKDIGTRFTVLAYDPEEGITVEVMEGEVLFYTYADSGISLKENETGYYDSKLKQFSYIKKQQTTFILDTEEEELLLPLSTGKDLKTEEPILESKTEKSIPSSDNLEFNSTYLYEVVDVLKTRYHVDDIIFEDNTMRTMQISISFNAKQSIDEILEIIAETLSIQISKHGNVYIISK